MTLTTLLPYILQIVEDAVGSKWGPIMILLSGWIVQILTQDSKFPIQMPASWNQNVWKPVVVLLASMFQAIIASHFEKHMDWVHAVLLGLRTSVWTLGLWALIVKAAWNGQPPKWVNWLAFIATPPQPKTNAVDREAVTLSGKDVIPLPPPPKKPPGAA
jgi:hypothetical protein